MHDSFTMGRSRWKYNQFYLKSFVHNMQHRVPVSMGAVGALAATVFVCVGTSTHGFGNFSYISINFHKDYAKKVMILFIFLVKSNL